MVKSEVNHHLKDMLSEIFERQVGFLIEEHIAESVEKFKTSLERKLAEVSLEVLKFMTMERVGTELRITIDVKDLDKLRGEG